MLRTCTVHTKCLKDSLKHAAMHTHDKFANLAYVYLLIEHWGGHIKIMENIAPGSTLHCLQTEEALLK